MKYRIVQDSKTSFRVQRSGLFFWNNFSRYIGGQFSVPIYFDTKEEAMEKIREYHEEFYSQKFPIFTYVSCETNKEQ